MKKFSFLASVVVMMFSAFVMSANAQSSDDIKLNFSRDFGYSSGTGNIQGLFSIKASSDYSLTNVDFYIDEILIGKDDTEPFKLQFNTDNYPEGNHDVYAIATTTEGKAVRSKDINVTFLSAEDSRSDTIKLVVPILGIALLVAVLAAVIPAVIGKKKGSSLPPGSERNYGAAGGSICRKCKRPFARNLLAPNLLVGKLVRCPHCGKWGIYSALPIDELRKAEKEELAGSSSSTGLGDDDNNEDEKLKKILDDSRFDDM